MKTKFIILFALVIGLMSCENQESEFDDFGSTSVYFPFQTPVRTLIQGKYDLGFNDNDNNGKFEIGVTMSGVYSNESDRKVYFEVDPNLIDPTNLEGQTVNYFIAADESVVPVKPEVVNPVQILPSGYYTLDQSPVTIPAGSTKGRIGVQLTDDFFNDPLSIGEFGASNYVIPLKIMKQEGLDSILRGAPIDGVTDPKRLIEGDWSISPKDYTLFGVKFINKYDGMYLRRGADRIVGSLKVERLGQAPVESNIDESLIYRNEFVVRDQVTPVVTAGRKIVTTNTTVERGEGRDGGGDLALKLTFDDDDNAVVSNVDPNSDFQVTGTGKLVANGDEWGGKKRDVIYLQYEYPDVQVSEVTIGPIVISRTTTDLTHTVNDTLVIRDRNIKFEEFVVKLTAPVAP